MDLNELNTVTKRVTNYKIDEPVKEDPESPNCGLNCYLTEAYILAEMTNKERDPNTEKVIKSLLAEKQVYAEYNNKYFWGWEKDKLTDGKKFPLDWDDTSKAIDCLRVAREYDKSGYLDYSKLPNDQDLNSIFRKSIFKLKTVGEEEKIDCPYSTALSVFFGPGSEEYKKKERDDPMVTISTIRMLAKWHPNVIKENRRIVLLLIKRAIYIFNYLLNHKNIQFKVFSRYYFSLGHFAFRLFETIELLAKCKIKININNSFFMFRARLSSNEFNFEKIKKKMEFSYSILNNGTSNDNDNFWWYLLGLKLELINAQYDFKEKIDNSCSDRIIYQHRRLKHQYFSEDWEKKLLIFELKKHDKFVHRSNENNFKGLGFLKKATIPIFAISAFLVYCVHFSIYNSEITKNIINNTNIFNTQLKNDSVKILQTMVTELKASAKIAEDQLAKIQYNTDITFPYLKFILSSIFIIIGIRLYVQAWAVEETYLTNRIVAPIKHKTKRHFLIAADSIIRFIWTTLIMIFPIYLYINFLPNSLSWHRYLTIIYGFIFIWDLSILFSYKNLYKKLEKIDELKLAKKYWFRYDVILLILAVITTFTIDNDGFMNNSYKPVFYLVIYFVLMGLSIYQMKIFFTIIFSNKIRYKYDS